MLKFVIAFPLIMHGLANLGGVAAFLFGASAGFPDGPWLFSANIKRRSVIGRLWGVLWLGSALALIAGGLGAAFQQGWWQSAALVGCGLSLFSILPWWRSVVPGAKFGAIFDILVIIFLLTPLANTIV